MSAIREEQPAGRRLEKLAFDYCKIATFSLLFGRFALPVASVLATGLFSAAYFKGIKDTKCWFRLPLLAGGFWLVILGLWLWIELTPGAPWWIAWIHR